MNTVDVTFPDGRRVSVRTGTRVADLIEEYAP